MSLPMEKATYRARVCGAAQFEQGDRNMQIALPFEIVDDEFTGETITWFAALHGTPDKKGKTGKDRVLESLTYTGWQGDDLTELMEISDDQARSLMPDVVEIVCEPEEPNEYHDDWRLRVQWVNRPGGGRASFKKPLSKDEMRSFAAQMKSSLRNARGPRSNGKPAQRSLPNHPNAPGGDDPFANNEKDDVPF